MGGVLGMSAAEELAAIPGVDKEREGVPQGGEGASEAARAATQARQVVAQLRVVGFDGIRLALIRQRDMVAGIVDEIDVARIGVGVLPLRTQRAVEQRLQARWLPVGGDLIAQQAARGAIHQRNHVEPLFFVPANV